MKRARNILKKIHALPEEARMFFAGLVMVLAVVMVFGGLTTHLSSSLATLSANSPKDALSQLTPPGNAGEETAPLQSAAQTRAPYGPTEGLLETVKSLEGAGNTSYSEELLGTMESVVTRIQKGATLFWNDVRGFRF